jgi:hypothetical protein
MAQQNSGGETETIQTFATFVPKDKKTVTSTDGTTTMLKPRSLCKKIGQRKRKINERTTTFKKKTMSDGQTVN